MKRRYLLLAITICLFLIPLTADANVMGIYGYGPRASAMGMAYVGLADDYSAIYYNPAGLVQIPTNSVGFGYFLADPDLELDLTPTLEATDEQRRAIDGMAGEQADITEVNGYMFGATVRPREWLAAGLAVFLPEGLVVRLEPISSRLPSFALHENHTQRAVALFCVAASPIRSLSLGVGASLFAHVDGRLNVPVSVNNDNFSLDPDNPAPQAIDPLAELTIEFPMAIFPYAGIHWRATEWLSIGATYRDHYQWDVDVALDADLRVDRFRIDLASLERMVPDLFPLTAVVSVDIPNLGELEIPVTLAGLEGEIEVTARVPLSASMSIVEFWTPQEVALGAAFRIGEAFTITLDGIYSLWSQMPRPDMDLEIEDLHINLATLPTTLTVRIESISIPVLGTIGPLPPIDLSIPQIDAELTVPIRIARASQPNTHDIIAPRAGFEYRFGPSRPVWRLDRFSGAVRAGYSYQPSPFSKPNGFTNLIAMDRHTFTAGAGVHFMRFVTLDFFGQYHHLIPIEADRDFTDPEFPYTRLKASGHLLTAGASIKLTW